jgi:hypothetical protein
MTDPRRWMVLLAACWLGVLLAVAGIATVSAFATLPRADAGRVVARVLASEAAVSVLAGAVLMVLQRAATRRRPAHADAPRQFDAALALPAAAVFCTLAGYYAIVPLMEQARSGTGPLGFAALHAISSAFYVARVALVATLAWTLSRPIASSSG